MSMWVAPATIAAISVQILRPGAKDPVRTHQLERRSRPSGDTNVAITISPALATGTLSSKVVTCRSNLRNNGVLKLPIGTGRQLT